MSIDVKALISEVPVRELNDTEKTYHEKVTRFFANNGFSVQNSLEALKQERQQHTVKSASHIQSAKNRYN